MTCPLRLAAELEHASRVHGSSTMIDLSYDPYRFEIDADPHPVYSQTPTAWTFSARTLAT